MAAAAAAAGAASSLAPSTSQRRLPFRPIPTRQPLLPIPNKALTLSPKRPRLLHPIAASSPSPPPPEDTEPTDPVKLAFARAAAYKKDRANPTPKPPPPPPPPSPPPPPQPSAKESVGSKEAFERALEYRNGNGGGLDAGSALLNPSPPFGQSTFTNKEGAFGKMAKKKGGYAYDETDFLGLGFFEKKRYQGPPPGLSQGIDPFSNEDFPEVEIVIGDPSKFGKSRRSTENQPVDDSESEETSRSKSSKQNEDEKVEETPLSTVIEPEDDENSESYKPRVTTWGMFPRPQNISKAYGGGRNISLGGETQSAEEKAAKDKRTRELLAAYIGGKNKTLDAKTKAECTKVLKLPKKAFTPYIKQRTTTTQYKCTPLQHTHTPKVRYIGADRSNTTLSTTRATGGSTGYMPPRRDEAAYDKPWAPRRRLQQGYDIGVPPLLDPRIRVSPGTTRQTVRAATTPSRRERASPSPVRPKMDRFSPRPTLTATDRHTPATTLPTQPHYKSNRGLNRLHATTKK